MFSRYIIAYGLLFDLRFFENDSKIIVVRLKPNDGETY